MPSVVGGVGGPLGCAGGWGGGGAGGRGRGGRPRGAPPGGPYPGVMPSVIGVSSNALMSPVMRSTMIPTTPPKQKLTQNQPLMFLALTTVHGANPAISIRITPALCSRLSVTTIGVVPTGMLSTNTVAPGGLVAT